MLTINLFPVPLRYRCIMCRHLLNAKVAIQSTCCKGWFECPECHDEQQPDHELIWSDKLCMVCLACRKIFWRDMSSFSLEDGRCPECERDIVVPAETPESRLMMEAQAYFMEQLMKEVEGCETKFKEDTFSVDNVVEGKQVDLSEMFATGGNKEEGDSEDEDEEEGEGEQETEVQGGEEVRQQESRQPVPARG